MRKLHTVLAAVTLSVAAALSANGAANAQAPGAATIAGVVRDSAGKPIADAEVLLRDRNRGTRTNDRGEFTLGDVPPGNYRVWFRHLGYASVEYNWAARNAQRTDVNVVLREIPRTLDPVIVRAQEDKRSRAQSSILGLVIDSANVAIPEAEVQLVGADMSGMTRDNGGFLFKPLAVGPYVIRVRKIGYAPATVTLQLTENDDREVVVRMTPLAQGLDPVVVTERSGYDPRDDLVWKELEQRKRWVNFKSRFLGPEDLKGYYGVRLDDAMRRMGMYFPTAGGKAMQPRSIGRVGQQKSAYQPPNPDANACLLLNGKTPLVWPLRAYNTADVELLEVYPTGTELTHSVSSHFHGPPCEAVSMFDHPTYYVLWLKGQK